MNIAISKNVINFIIIFFFAQAAKAQIKAMTDGPYVFYKNDMVLVKSLRIIDGKIKVIGDSFLLKDAYQHPLNVSIEGHPDWDFTVSLKDKIVPPASVSGGAGKTLILSDIEGEFEPFRNLLLQAKVIDEKYNWTFGDGNLIIAGDLFDRGKQVSQFLWLLYKLEQEAAAKGGEVHTILGNHDIMNLSGDFRYVQPEYQANAMVMKEPYQNFYGANTELGRWLRSKNIMEKIGDLLVVHGGISPALNDLHLPIDSINNWCRPFYESAMDIADEKLQPFFSGKTSPFWYRGYFLAPTATMEQIDRTLEIYQCRKIVVGHDIIEHVSMLYDRKVIGVDVNEHEGTHEALLIENDNYYRIDDKGAKVAL